MAEFSVDHAEVAALRFFVQRLLMSRCMESADPLATAEAIWQAAAEEESRHVEAGLKHGGDAALLAIEIGGALKDIADQVLSDVRAIGAQRP